MVTGMICTGKGIYEQQVLHIGCMSVFFLYIDTYSQLAGAENDDDVKMLFAVDEISALLMETGYRKPVTYLTLCDRPGLRATLMDYHCMLKAKAAMDQLAEGLQTIKVWDLIQKFPLLTKPFFVSDGKKITAREMIVWFTMDIYIFIGFSYPAFTWSLAN